jgi:transcriptional regulator with XRE-family HTH domain
LHLDLQKTLGRKIRDLRKAKGFSQESFADHCAVHRTYMGNVERGAINISFQNMVKIAGGLGITLAALMAGIEATAAKPSNDTSFLSPASKTEKTGKAPGLRKAR